MGVADSGYKTATAVSLELTTPRYKTAVAVPLELTTHRYKTAIAVPLEGQQLELSSAIQK